MMRDLACDDNTRGSPFVQLPNSVSLVMEALPKRDFISRKLAFRGTHPGLEFVPKLWLGSPICIHEEIPGLTQCGPAALAGVPPKS